MNTGGKIILAVGFLALSGLGVFLYFKSKINNTTGIQPSGNDSLTSSSLDIKGNLTSSISSASSPSALTSNPPIQLPSDLSAAEMDAVKNFCNLPVGQSTGILKPNFDIKTQWGVVNTLYIIHLKGNAGMSVNDYFNGLKKYLGCLS